MDKRLLDQILINYSARPHRRHDEEGMHAKSIKKSKFS